MTQEKNRFLARISVYFADLLNVFKTGFATMKAVFSSYSTPYSIINADYEELLNLIRSASKNRYDEEKLKELVEAARNSIAVRTHISDEERYHILSLMDSVHYLELQLHKLDYLIDAKASQFPAYRMLLSFTGSVASQLLPRLSLNWVIYPDSINPRKSFLLLACLDKTLIQEIL